MVKRRRGEFTPRGGAGGSRQQAVDDEDSAYGPSKLVSLLANLFWWGFIPTVTDQRICFAATKDGCDHPDVMTTSGIGNYGEFSSNCYPDLLHIWSESYLHNFLHDMEMPLTIYPLAPRMYNQSVLDPHEAFSYM